MQFFLANLYSERLSGAPVTAEEYATPSSTPVAPVATNDDARISELALAGSR